MVKQLFCRPVPPHYATFADAVDTLLHSPKEEHRAIALNMIYDHRVSQARAEHFITFVHKSAAGPGLNGQAILNGLRDYRKAFAATPKESFDEGPEVSSNYVEVCPNLVHICNVTSKLIRISGASAANPTIGDALTRMRFGNRALNNPAAVDEELRSKFVTEQGRSSFVKGFLGLLNLYRTISPWSPVWLARWEEFDGSTDTAIAASWPESVGLPCSPSVEWILVLRLRTTDVTQLYRPTLFEAGDFPYHFPSPPCAPLASGGHPMSLRPSAALGALLLEYVHTELPFNPDGWKDADRRIGPVARDRKYDIMAYRRRHYDLLVDTYGKRAVHDWMRDPTKHDD